MYCYNKKTPTIQGYIMNTTEENNADLMVQEEPQPKGFDSEFFHEDVRKVYEMQQLVIETLQDQKERTTAHYDEVRKITADLREIMVSNSEKTAEILKFTDFITKEVGPAFGKLLEKINKITESDTVILEEIKKYQQNQSKNMLIEIIKDVGAIQQMIGSVMRTCHTIKGEVKNVDDKVETIKMRTPSRG